MNRRPELQQYITREETESYFMRLIEGCVKPNWICVDVGACRGAFTFLFASMLSEEGKVVAFEPFHENVSYLQSVVQSTGLQKIVQIEHAAVNDGSTSEVSLFGGRNLSAYEWNILGKDMNGQSTDARFNVKATSLDQYFSNQDLPQVVKIDVEGAATLVLKGMQRIFSVARPILLIETHSPEEKKAVRDLVALNYELWDVHRDRPVEAGDPDTPYHVAVIPRA